MSMSISNNKNSWIHKIAVSSLLINQTIRATKKDNRISINRLMNRTTIWDINSTEETITTNTTIIRERKTTTIKTTNKIMQDMIRVTIRIIRKSMMIFRIIDITTRIRRKMPKSMRNISRQGNKSKDMIISGLVLLINKEARVSMIRQIPPSNLRRHTTISKKHRDLRWSSNRWRYLLHKPLAQFSNSNSNKLINRTSATRNWIRPSSSYRVLSLLLDPFLIRWVRLSKACSLTWSIWFTKIISQLYQSWSK